MDWMFHWFGTPIKTTHGHMFAAYVAGMIVMLVALILGDAITLPPPPTGA